MKKIIMTILALMLTLQIANGYEFNGKNYNIQYPENIERIEYDFMTGKLDKDNKYYKLVYLNVLLIKNGYKSIW